MGLEDKVELTGALSRENVAKKLSEANVLICYSRLETFGVTVIEAWASGIPVIASDSLGFLEYWEDNLGCIVSHKNTKMLSEKMLEMMREYKKYDSESIIQFAKEHFSEEVIYRRLLEIYQGGQ